MNAQSLIDTAGKLVAADKGLLAMDESNPTCNKRFAKLGIPQTEEARRAYRELLITTPCLGESISGVILCDETIRQQKKDGTPFLKVITDAGIIPGIKVDTGAKEMAGHPGEKITEGLDRLRDRLKEYFQMGARFAKWRAVIAISDGIPSRSCLEANAHALAIQLDEDVSQGFLGDLQTSLQSMFTVHEDFGFNDGNKSHLLAQRGIARQCVRVGF